MRWGEPFDFRPIADALAERGRVVVRRAYADWSYFEEDRRMLTRNQVELIEMPQRMGMVRKNAADIKMAVDAVELSFERDYITTFVLGTGDSDFTPLVHKLRELNRRVIGIGVEASTSALLPAACDEFLFYERLEGIEPGHRPAKRHHSSDARRQAAGEGAGGRAGAGGRPPRTPTSTRSSPARSPGSSAAAAARCSRRCSSAPSCARNRRSARPTTASAPSVSSCATWPTARWSRCSRGARPVIPR